MSSGPPFDGKPCAACPDEARSLYGAAMTLCQRIRGRSATDAVLTALAKEAEPEQDDMLFVKLRDVAKKLTAAGGYTRDNVEALEAAALAVKPLVELHLASAFHAHGIAG